MLTVGERNAFLRNKVITDTYNLLKKLGLFEHGEIVNMFNSIKEMIMPVDSDVGVGADVGVAAGTAGGTRTDFSEVGHKAATDIGSEESAAFATSLVNANMKRTYDVYQSQDLKIQSGLAEHESNVRNIATQALQNAVETANMVGKQAVRHGDIAIDRQWNVDEQGYAVAEILRDNTFKDALAAAVAIAVQNPAND